jgi:hypothetical protein
MAAMGSRRAVGRPLASPRITFADEADTRVLFDVHGGPTT